MPRYLTQPETREGAIRCLLQEVRQRLDKGWPVNINTRCIMDLATLGIVYTQAIEMAYNLKGDKK